MYQQKDLKDFKYRHVSFTQQHEQSCSKHDMCCVPTSVPLAVVMNTTGPHYS